MSNFDEKSYVRNGHLNTPSGLNVVICNVILQEQQIQYPFVYRDFIGIHISIYSSSQLLSRKTNLHMTVIRRVKPLIHTIPLPEFSVEPALFFLNKIVVGRPTACTIAHSVSVVSGHFTHSRTPERESKIKMGTIKRVWRL